MRRQRRRRAASAVMSEAWCWELQEQQAHEKCRRREAPLALAPDAFFSVCNHADISRSICSPPLSLVAKNLIWRVQVPPFLRGLWAPCGGLKLPCQKVSPFPQSRHVCVRLLTSPRRRHRFYSKLNKKRCVGSRIFAKKAGAWCAGGGGGGGR